MYKFFCAIYDASYVKEIQQHIKTRTDEHFDTDKKSHISQHQVGSNSCKSKSNQSFFKVTDTASSIFRLRKNEEKIWKKPALNCQKQIANF